MGVVRELETRARLLDRLPLEPERDGERQDARHGRVVAYGIAVVADALDPEREAQGRRDHLRRLEEREPVAHLAAVGVVGGGLGTSDATELGDAGDVEAHPRPGVTGDGEEPHEADAAADHSAHVVAAQDLGGEPEHGGDGHPGLVGVARVLVDEGGPDDLHPLTTEDDLAAAPEGAAARHALGALGIGVPDGVATLHDHPDGATGQDQLGLLLLALEPGLVVAEAPRVRADVGLVGGDPHVACGTLGLQSGDVPLVLGDPTLDRCLERAQIGRNGRGVGGVGRDPYVHRLDLGLDLRTELGVLLGHLGQLGADGDVARGGGLAGGEPIPTRLADQVVSGHGVQQVGAAVGVAVVVAEGRRTGGVAPAVGPAALAVVRGALDLAGRDVEGDRAGGADDGAVERLLRQEGVRHVLDVQLLLGKDGVVLLLRRSPAGAGGRRGAGGGRGDGSRNRGGGGRRGGRGRGDGRRAGRGGRRAGGGSRSGSGLRERGGGEEEEEECRDGTGPAVVRHGVLLVLDLHVASTLEVEPETPATAKPVWSSSCPDRAFPVWGWNPEGS